MKRARCEDLHVYYKVERIDDCVGDDGCGELRYMCTLHDYDPVFGVGFTENDAIIDARRKLLDLICYEYFPEVRWAKSGAYLCITYTEIQTHIKKNKAFHVYPLF